MSLLVLDRRAFLLAAIFPSVAVGLLNGYYLEALYRHSPFMFYVADATQWVLIPILVWIYILRPSGIKLREYGFVNPSAGTSNVESFGLFAFATVLLWFVYEPVRQLAYAFLWPYAGTFGYPNTIPTAFPLNFLVVVYYSATAALVEEVVFRGLPWLYFAIAVPVAHRKTWYLAVTSVLFAVSHFEQGPHGMIAAFTFGLVAALLYANLRNIWPLVAAHFVGDVVSFWPK